MAEMLAQPRLPGQLQTIARLQHRAHAPPDSTLDQAHVPAVLEGEDTQDSIRLTVRPRRQHQALILPFHASGIAASAARGQRHCGAACFAARSLRHQLQFGGNAQLALPALQQGHALDPGRQIGWIHHQPLVHERRAVAPEVHLLPRLVEMQVVEGGASDVAVGAELVALGAAPVLVEPVPDDQPVGVVEALVDPVDALVVVEPVELLVGVLDRVQAGFVQLMADRRADPGAVVRQVVEEVHGGDPLDERAALPEQLGDVVQFGGVVEGEYRRIDSGQFFEQPGLGEDRRRPAGEIPRQPTHREEVERIRERLHRWYRIGSLGQCRAAGARCGCLPLRWPGLCRGAGERSPFTLAPATRACRRRLSGR